MNLELEIMRFKMDLLRKMPFYGDIVMRLPILENAEIPTAQTNGRKIEYNPKFLSGLKSGERNFVLMHEVFHVLLFHCKRYGERNPQLWNTAADMIVNSMLTNLTQHMKRANIPFERPTEGIFCSVNADDTVEMLYEKLLADNRKNAKNLKKVTIRTSARPGQDNFTEKNAPNDIVLPDPDVDEAECAEEGGLPQGNGLSEQMILQIVRDAATANRGNIGSYYVPNQIIRPVESRRIKWQTLLRDVFTDDRSDEASYATPERKYLHMDMILPGNGLDEEKLEEVWAFVDSSGSISKDQLGQFLTQLYRISKEFKCIFNICYWDTSVTDVYKDIKKEDDILTSLPKHFGGTNINCVYRWIKENKVKPDAMLVLTDGYFGGLDNNFFMPSLGKKTILVLSGSIPINEDMKRIGKVTRL